MRIEIKNLLTPHTLPLTISAVAVGPPEPSEPIGRCPPHSQKYPSVTVRRLLGFSANFERLGAMNKTLYQLKQALLV